jgi:hypothetical protein
MKWSGKDLRGGEDPATSCLNHDTSIKVQFGLNNKYHLSSYLRMHCVLLRKTN